MAPKLGSKLARREEKPERRDRSVTFEALTERQQQVLLRTLWHLQVFGYLPTGILYEASRDLCKRRDVFVSDYLRQFWYGGYILRPRAQQDQGYFPNGPDVYDVRPDGVKVLDNHGLLVPSYAQKNPFPHGVMTGSVVASIYVIAEHLGWSVTLPHDLGYKKSISLPMGKLELRPDYHFVLERPDVPRPLELFVEADRASERRKKIRDKLKLYAELAKTRKFRVLFVTTTNTQQEMILDECRKLHDDGMPWVMVQVWPTFASGGWRPSNQPNHHLVFGPWKRATRPDFTIAQ